LSFFYSAGSIIIVFIRIMVINRRSPNETIGDERFKERLEPRAFRFSHASVVSDPKFQAEQIGRIAGSRSVGVSEI
jgi:hypothetical protein